MRTFFHWDVPVREVAMSAPCEADGACAVYAAIIVVYGLAVAAYVQLGWCAVGVGVFGLGEVVALGLMLLLSAHGRRVGFEPGADGAV